MRGSLTTAGFCAVVLSVGCGESISPAGPSVVSVAATGVSGIANGAAGTTTLVSAGHRGTNVPFKGSLEGRYGTPTGQFPVIHESIVSTGQATHLGRYTLEIAETVNLLQASATGTFTFTAADGDTVYGSFIGHAQVGPLVAIVEEATVLGGTGRFSGATGSFSIDRLFDPVNRTTTGSFEGTISSAGAGLN